MKIKVASRGSKLALIQVKEIMHKLFYWKYLHEDHGPSYEIFKEYDNFEDAYEVRTITTKGDKLITFCSYGSNFVSILKIIIFFKYFIRWSVIFMEILPIKKLMHNLFNLN